MDIFRNMQIFVEVAREKSFRGAADSLGIPNSTVSRRIVELESEVGLRLFDRSTRRVTLTDAGRLHFANCERILDDARLAREPLADLRASLAEKEVDVAFVMGPVTQGDLVARRIIHLKELGLYASPNYIREHGEPTSPAELSEHEGFTHLQIPEWHLVHTDSGKVETVLPNGRISIANFQALQKLSLKDMGICVWHDWRARNVMASIFSPLSRGLSV